MFLSLAFANSNQRDYSLLVSKLISIVRKTFFLCRVYSIGVGMASNFIFEKAYSRLRNCKECVKVLSTLLKNPLGISSWGVHKATGMAYTTIRNCMKVLEELELVASEERPSKKGGITMIWKSESLARRVYDYTINRMSKEGESKVEVLAEKVATGLDMPAEDLLERIAKKLKKRKRIPPEYRQTAEENSLILGES